LRQKRWFTVTGEIKTRINEGLRQQAEFNYRYKILIIIVWLVSHLPYFNLTNLIKNRDA